MTKVKYITQTVNANLNAYTISDPAITDDCSIRLVTSPANIGILSAVQEGSNCTFTFLPHPFPFNVRAEVSTINEFKVDYWGDEDDAFPAPDGRNAGGGGGGGDVNRAYVDQRDNYVMGLIPTVDVNKNYVDSQILSVNSVASNAYNQANSAYSQANYAYDWAEDAYNHANNAYNAVNAIVIPTVDVNKTYVDQRDNYVIGLIPTVDVNKQYVDAATSAINATVASVSAQTSNAFNKANSAWHGNAESILTAGSGITIEGNTITSTGGTGGVTQEYVDLRDNYVMGLIPTVDVNKTYVDAEVHNVLNKANEAYNEAYLAYSAAITAQGAVGAAWNTANNAYNAANDAANHANSLDESVGFMYEDIENVYNRSNDAYNRANSAYSEANAASERAEDAVHYALNVATNVNLAYNQANEAWDMADTASVYANWAYDAANDAFNQASDAYNQANAAFLYGNNRKNEVGAAVLAKNGTWLPEYDWNNTIDAINSIVSGGSSIPQYAHGITTIGTTAGGTLINVGFKPEHVVAVVRNAANSFKYVAYASDNLYGNGTANEWVGNSQIAFPAGTTNNRISNFTDNGFYMARATNTQFVNVGWYAWSNEVADARKLDLDVSDMFKADYTGLNVMRANMVSPTVSTYIGSDNRSKTYNINVGVFCNKSTTFNVWIGRLSSESSAYQKQTVSCIGNQWAYVWFNDINLADMGVTGSVIATTNTDYEEYNRAVQMKMYESGSLMALASMPLMASAPLTSEQKLEIERQAELDRINAQIEELQMYRNSIGGEINGIYNL